MSTMIGRRSVDVARDRYSGKRPRFEDRQDVSPQPSSRTREIDGVSSLRSPLTQRTRSQNCASQKPESSDYSDFVGKTRNNRRLKLEDTNSCRHDNSEMRDREVRGSRQKYDSNAGQGRYYQVDNQRTGRNGRHLEIDTQRSQRNGYDRERRNQDNKPRRIQPPRIPKLNSASEFPALPGVPTNKENHSTVASKRSRQSTESSDSSWGEIVLEEEERRDKVKDDLARMQSRFKSTHSEEDAADPQTAVNDQVNDQDIQQKMAESYECDLEVLVRRQKQLDYGKRTSEYSNYRKAISRQERLKDFPWTPNKFQRFSRRKWDTKIRVWRKVLHVWDPPNNNSVDDGVSVTSEISYEGSTTANEIESTPGSSQADEQMISESLGRISVTPPPVREGDMLNFNSPLKLHVEDDDDAEFLEV